MSVSFPSPPTRHCSEMSLIPACKSLTGPSCQPLNVCGQFTGTLRHGSCTSKEEIFVVKSLQMSLLGCPATEALGLVSRVNTEGDQRQHYTAKYSDLFRGLGKTPGTHHIQLKDDAKPFALSNPRRVALPLQPKVKAKLQRMEQMGVTSKADDPTDQCTGMVVVPKPDGKVCICVDLTKLNESVCEERHILPSVDHTFAQLGGAKVFTNLDASSGFWQRISSFHHLHHPFWAILLQPTPIWNHLSTRALPKDDVRNPQRPRRSCLHGQ